MALNLASPSILVREVDLTIGRIDGSTGKIGGIVGPFEKVIYRSRNNYW